MGFKAARSAELMNQSLSSSTLSMDRIHEEKFDVEDRLQKVREELEDIKRQNEEYQKNLGLMARKKESLERELKQTQKELANAKSTIHKLENDTLTHLSLGRQAVQSDNDNNQIYDMYQDALHKIEKQEQIIAQKDNIIETSSNISSDRDIQSHQDQAQVQSVSKFVNHNFES